MQSNESRLSIPCQWDEKSLMEILNFESTKGIGIKEVYGTLSMEGVPHGRSHEATPRVDKDYALRLKQMISRRGIKFAYLINAPLELDSYEFLLPELDWIINTFKADSITITSIGLMEFIRRQFPQVKINVSTIAGIQTKEDVKKYLHIKPSRVITHHDVNRNFADLKEIIVFLNDLNIELEIMLNESCLRRCSRRSAHYNTLGKECDDREFHLWCNNIRLLHPYQFLQANFIRPEDVYVYEDMGVKAFKVTGRSKPLWWLPEVVNSYLNRKYSGNLIRLLGIDPKLMVEEFVYLDNDSLDKFLKEYPKDGEVHKEIEYCSKVISELLVNKKFLIRQYDLKEKMRNEELMSCKA